MNQVIITEEKTENQHEWYTPGWLWYPILEVLGEIDLDPCMPEDPKWQQTLLKRSGAKTFYTKSDNGLAQDWIGKVFCNPPYDRFNLPAFSNKLEAAYIGGQVPEALFLVPARSSSKWCQHLMKKYYFCLLEGRPQFDNPDKVKGSGFTATAIFYLGKNTETFIEVFDGLGVVCRSFSLD